MSQRSRQILQGQQRVFAALAIGVVILVLGFWAMGVGPAAPLAQGRGRALDLPGDKINPQEVWMSRMEGASSLMDQKIQHLERLILEQSRREEEKNRENTDLRSEISRLRDELRAQERKAKEAYVPPPPPKIQEPWEQGLNGYPRFAEEEGSGLQILVMEEPEQATDHVKRSISAGTSVKALLVGSVDAPCGVFSPTDPQPVKLRILDDGHLPKGVSVLLKGGVVIGSAYGDLSSERVYMRLERLTKNTESGDFVETEVVGYVSGEDGKYGVRGVVADKSATLVSSAAFSGFFSGVSQFLQATINAQDLADATQGLPNNIRWDLVREGASAGATSALDRLADYYIHRAEQIQPVIQVAAGRVVDITFTHGCSLGDLNTKDKVRRVREKNRELS